MNSSYKLSQEAKDDLQRIYEYGFLNFGEQQADDYFFGFFETFEKIASYPLHYQSVDNIRVGYKRCTYRCDTIYFRVNGQKIEIMAIIGGQDTDVWL
jgi:toxin ParE1/3/4